MTLIDSRKFEFEGEEYDVKVIADDSGYKVAVFCDGKRVNPYTYSVDFDIDGNVRARKSLGAYEHLMDVAESDVKEKRWESYLDAVRKLNENT